MTFTRIVLALTECSGKAGMMITVEYPPGHSDEIHRHNTHDAGQTYYEGPDDEHIVGRNASKTKPAKFVAFFLENKGAPILEPAE